MATQLPEDFWLKLERELPLLLTRRDVKMYCGSLNFIEDPDGYWLELVPLR